MMTVQKTNEILDNSGVQVFESYQNLEAANERINNLELENQVLKKNWISAEKNLITHRDLASNLQGRLKQCRRIMRDNGIGHLYPGTNVEAEAGKMMTMESNSNELRQVIEVGQKQVGKQLEEMQEMRHIIGGLVSLLTENEISTKEIEKVLRRQTDADKMLKRLDKQKQFMSMEGKENGDTSIAEGNQTGESLSA